MSESKETEAEEKPKSLQVPFWLDDGVPYEAVLDCSDILREPAPNWLTFEDGQFKLEDEIQVNGRVLKPARTTTYAYAGEPVLPVALLYEDVYEVFSDYFSHLDGRVNKFLALYTLHSYVLTKSAGTIFLWFVGRKRSGKTTVQLIFERLAYRPFAAVDPTEATVFRTLGCEVEYGPLIIVKEFERASASMRQIAREGNIPGSTVPRVDKDTTGAFFVNSYHTYGGRVVGSNKIHGDEADMDRYCTIKCMKLKPRRPRSELLRKDEVMRRLSSLRDALLVWKVASYQELKFPYEDPTGAIQDGRDWENYGGIITLAGMVSPELESEIRDFVSEHLRESEEDEKSAVASLLLESVQNLATVENREGDSYRIAFRDIWEGLKVQCTEHRAKDGSIDDNLVSPKGEVISTTKAGRILKDQLMGKPDRWEIDGKTQRGYVWAAQILRALSPTGSTSPTGLGGQKEPFQTALPINENESTEAQNPPLRPLEPVGAVGLVRDGGSQP